MKLNELRPAFGATHSKKRVGRGNASGHGSTSSRGNKGAGQRTGATSDPRFEGGQTPLYRRLPKVGFINKFREPFTVVNLERLKDFSDGTNVDVESLKNAGIISGPVKVKILGDGDLSKKLNFKVHACSQSARKKIEAKGGVIEIIGAVGTIPQAVEKKTTGKKRAKKSNKEK